MDYSYAIEQRDISKIDKLNKLYDINTYWDNVRKLTKSVKSDHSIKRWQCLADARYKEVIKEELDNFYYLKGCLRGEIGNSRMDNVEQWILGKGSLATYDMSNSSISSAYNLKKLYNTLVRVGAIK